MQKIIINNVSKKFGDFYALRDMSLEVLSGEKLVIHGSSGSGKSTLLYLLGGLDRATSGEIVAFGQNLTKMSDKQLALHRNEQVGFIFQFHFLLGTLTGLENVLLPAQINGNVSLRDIKKDTHRFAEVLGVSDVLNKLPTEMSGGQQQRINILRAISMRPRILLCDEPTGNLDSKNSKIVIDLLDEIAEETNSTLIVVTHDQSIALRFERQIEILDGGISNQLMNTL